MLKNEIVFILKRLPRLILGLFLCSVAILLTIYAGLGAGPWDVFHIGIVNHTSLTLGQISQIIGLIVITASFFIGIIPGVGTLLNIYLVGVFLDLLQKTNIFFIPSPLWGKLLMLIIGLWIFGWGSYFYIGSSLGAGARDGLMLGLIKRSNKSVYFIRTIIEVSVLIIGIVLGGPFGVGTIIISLTIGYSVQSAFKLGKYNPSKEEHRTILDLINAYKFKDKKESEA